MGRQLHGRPRDYRREGMTVQLPSQRATAIPTCNCHPNVQLPSQRGTAIPTWGLPSQHDLYEASTEASAATIASPPACKNSRRLATNCLRLIGLVKYFVQPATWARSWSPFIE